MHLSIMGNGHRCGRPELNPLVGVLARFPLNTYQSQQRACLRSYQSTYVNAFLLESDLWLLRSSHPHVLATCPLS
jgi:hypothetical protein